MSGEFSRIFSRKLSHTEFLILNSVLNLIHVQEVVEAVWWQGLWLGAGVIKVMQISKWCKYQSDANVLKSPIKKLKIEGINMSQLRKIYNKLNKSNTISKDRISMNTLNKLKTSTQPLILRLVNIIIKTKKYPKELKVSRIVPIQKNLVNWITWNPQAIGQ